MRKTLIDEVDRQGGVKVFDGSLVEQAWEIVRSDMEVPTIGVKGLDYFEKLEYDFVATKRLHADALKDGRLSGDVLLPETVEFLPAQFRNYRSLAILQILNNRQEIVRSIKDKYAALGQASYLELLGYLLSQCLCKLPEAVSLPVDVDLNRFFNEHLRCLINMGTYMEYRMVAFRQSGETFNTGGKLVSRSSDIIDSIDLFKICSVSDPYTSNSRHKLIEKFRACCSGKDKPLTLKTFIDIVEGRDDFKHIALFLGFCYEKLPFDCKINPTNDAAVNKFLDDVMNVLIYSCHRECEDYEDLMEKPFYPETPTLPKLSQYQLLLEQLEVYMKLQAIQSDTDDKVNEVIERALFPDGQITDFVESTKGVARLKPCIKWLTRIGFRDLDRIEAELKEKINPIAREDVDALYKIMDFCVKLWNLGVYYEGGQSEDTRLMGKFYKAFVYVVRREYLEGHPGKDSLPFQIEGKLKAQVKGRAIPDLTEVLATTEALALEDSQHMQSITVGLRSLDEARGMAREIAAEVQAEMKCLEDRDSSGLAKRIEMASADSNKKE